MAMAKKETQFTPMMARPYYIWRWTSSGFPQHRCPNPCPNLN